MIKKIDLYIIKKFLGTYVFAIALIISIVVVFDVNEKLDALLKAPLKATVFDYYLNFIPYFVSLFSPLFTFISVIFFTSKLADNSEIIAMLASGISFKRLLSPYMVSAGIIAGVNFYLNSYIIPPATSTRIEFQNTYVKNKKVDNASNKQQQVEKQPAHPAETMLDVENVTIHNDQRKKDVVKDVSFKVHAGEIVCLAGIEGNGQTELVYGLTGLEKLSGGKITLDGKDITRESIRQRSKDGMSHIPEDRHKHGLVLDYSLEHNIVLQRY